MKTQFLDYQDGDTVLEAYVAYEESDQQKPLVLVAHDDDVAARAATVAHFRDGRVESLTHNKR